jgi:hypothetical protein
MSVFFNYSYFGGRTNVLVYAQVLVGSNTWVPSNTNWVYFSKKEVKNGLLRLQSAFLDQSVLVPFSIYEHELDGERFLFSSRLGRVCQIPDSAVPTFAVNTNTALMMVSFGASAPPVNYNVKTGQIVP